MIIMSCVVYGMAFDFLNISGSLFRNYYDFRIRSSAGFIMMMSGFGAFFGGIFSGIVLITFTHDGVRTGITFGFRLGYALIIAIAFAVLFKHKHHRGCCCCKSY
jgi:NHS family xanthosine MFS transporter